jgi:hypothetical protein
MSDGDGFLAERGRDKIDRVGSRLGGFGVMLSYADEGCFAGFRRRKGSRRMTRWRWWRPWMTGPCSTSSTGTASRPSRAGRAGAGGDGGS